MKPGNEREKELQIRVLNNMSRYRILNMLSICMSMYIRVCVGGVRVYVCEVCLCVRLF